MLQVIFATGNEQKLHMGQIACGPYGISLHQNDLNIDEVQSEDGEYVARRKAEAAYKLLKKPVLISDDAWHIHGLNGFPGTYAKSVNTWFRADDYLRLTKDLEDRQISLVQTLIYQDSELQQLFVQKTTGILLKYIAAFDGPTIQQVVSFDPNGKLSIAEALTEDNLHTSEITLKVWHDFAKWYVGEAR